MVIAQTRYPLKIGFDAKRLFNNFTGLGNYSRTLVQNLERYFPQHEYLLFTPETTLAPRTSEFFNEQAYRIVMPKYLASLWRSHRILYHPLFKRLQVYHGLSHELPFGIRKSNVFRVVTIHDLIFRYFPEDYTPIDRKIYDTKFDYACREADAVIAISHQTKRDIIKYYSIQPEKIQVIYQSCDPGFLDKLSVSAVQAVKAEFDLPDDYLLYVGSVIKRKNLGNVVRALHMIEKDQRPPLVIIGSGKKYEQEVRSLIHSMNLDSMCHWINPPFDQFPAIYTGARAFVLPSFFEGFGIPLLEAMSTGTPVITSDQSAPSEIVGQAGLTIPPDDIGAICNAIQKIMTDNELHQELVFLGKERAQLFRPEKLTEKVMKVYQRSGH